MTKKFFVSGLALGLGLSTTAIGQERDDTQKGVAVTLTGCVITDKENSFVLTQVKQLSGPRSTTSSPTPAAMSGMEGGGPNEVTYWLSNDSVKLMRGHLGHRVRVTGVLTEVTTGTVQIKQEPGKPGPDNTVKIESEGKEASGKTDTPVGGPVVKSDTTQAVTIHQVKVDTVKLLAKTCS